MYKCRKFRKTVVEKLSTELPTAVDSLINEIYFLVLITVKSRMKSVTQRTDKLLFFCVQINPHDNSYLEN
ncbi:hypothetical protein LNA01_14550 [Companilactobacillus nantensis]|nr:hypothetical protein LNA01_14550 [Companilactobacillus nantensis]